MGSDSDSSLTNPLPISTKEIEEDLRTSHTVTLLTTATVVFISLVDTTATAAFSFLFFSTSSFAPQIRLDSTVALSRPLSKLEHLVVLIISFDRFRFGYQYKTHLPNINRLIQNGTVAEHGLIPVFPTQTFPNHYLIVTGLYLSRAINNYFNDPIKT